MSRSFDLSEREVKASKQDLKNLGIKKVILVSKLSSYLIVEMDSGEIITKIIRDKDIQHHIVDCEDNSCSSKTIENEEFKPPK